MQCLYCGNENPENAKFCNECGKSLIPIEVQTSLDAALSDASEDVQANTSKPYNSLPDLPVIDLYGDSEDEEAKDDYGDYYDDEYAYPESMETIAIPPVDYEGEHDDNEYPYYGEASETISFGGAAETQELDAIAGEDYRSYDDYAGFSGGSTMAMPKIASERSAEQAVYSADDPNGTQRGGFKRKLLIGLGVLLAIAAVFFVLYQMEIIGGLKVPDVIGMTQQEATAVLEAKGFKVTAREVKSDDIEGTVLLTDPMAGGRREAGQEIVIHVATPRIISEVLGLSEEEAIALLKADGYENITVVKKKSDEEEGKVLEVSPAVGERAYAATPVTLTVAEAYRVPDVVGMSRDAAIEAVEAEGLEVSLAKVYDESLEENTVASCDPEPGSKVNSGSTVTLYIVKSRATELCDLAEGILSDADTITIEGKRYDVSGQDASSIEYVGDDKVAFSITARATTELDGETVYGSWKTISAYLCFDSDNDYTFSW